LTPIKASYSGATLHQDREGEIYSIPDPETMEPEEREAFLKLLKARLGTDD
jgi:hypothetical protein